MSLNSLVHFSRKEHHNFFDNFRFYLDYLNHNSGGNNFIIPNIDVVEEDSRLIVMVDLPGLDEKDLDLQLNEGTLIIKGNKAAEHDEKKGKYHVFERYSGTFMRSIPIPFNVSVDKLSAFLENGVLIVEIPKPKESGKDLHTIKIPISKKQC